MFSFCLGGGGRVKKQNKTKQEYDAVNGSYRVTPEVLSKAKASAVLMHPLPRVGEVTEDCDLDPRAAYFKQMEVRCSLQPNGVHPIPAGGPFWREGGCSSSAR